MQRIARLDSKIGVNIQTTTTKKQYFAFVRKGKIWVEHRRMLKYFVEVGTLVKKKQLDVIVLSEAELTQSTVSNPTQRYVTI